MLARTNVLCLIIAFVMAIACLSQDCSAQGPKKKALRREQNLEAAGVIEGAIWRFSLKPQKGSGAQDKPGFRGKFRINNFEIFQGENPDGELTKKIGTAEFKEDQGGKATFEKIGGYTANKKWIEMSGQADLKSVKGVANKGGVWEGVFHDKDGFKWEMNINRFQE